LLHSVLSVKRILFIFHQHFNEICFSRDKSKTRRYSVVVHLNPPISRTPMRLASSIACFVNLLFVITIARLHL
jgi:hypothetical protein